MLAGSVDSAGIDSLSPSLCHQLADALGAQSDALVRASQRLDFLLDADADEGEDHALVLVHLFIYLINLLLLLLLLLLLFDIILQFPPT